MLTSPSIVWSRLQNLINKLTRVPLEAEKKGTSVLVCSGTVMEPSREDGRLALLSSGVGQQVSDLMETSKWVKWAK